MDWNEMVGLISGAKDYFFLLGSLAGLWATFRPVFESRFSRDIKKAEALVAEIGEQSMADLTGWATSRSFPGWIFRPLDSLVNRLDNNQASVRFNGPLSPYLTEAIQTISDRYLELRKLVQVNEWVPVIPKIAGTEDSDYENMSWDFNKMAFYDRSGVLDPNKDYVVHLDLVYEHAKALRKAFSRFQVLSEFHFLESIPLLRKFFVRRQMQKADLE